MKFCVEVFYYPWPRYRGRETCYMLETAEDVIGWHAENYAKRSYLMSMMKHWEYLCVRILQDVKHNMLKLISSILFVFFKLC